MTISATTQGLRQGVCTSSNRPATPFEGQMIYETDTDLTFIYGGSAWQQVSGGTAVGNSGLVYVKSQTVGTGVSSVTVSDAFSTTYDNYQIQLSGGVGSADANLRLTLGSTATGYYAGGLYVGYTASTVTGTNTNNGAFIDIGYGSTNALSGRGEIESPFLAKRTVFRTNPVSSSTGYPFGIFGGFLNDATSYTAFTITPSGGTMTGGTITVYGYRKA